MLESFSAAFPAQNAGPSHLRDKLPWHATNVDLDLHLDLHPSPLSFNVLLLTSHYPDHCPRRNPDLADTTHKGQ